MKRRLQLTLPSLKPLVFSLLSLFSPSSSGSAPSSAQTKSNLLDLARRLRRLRPVLVTYWLRWSLNSLPASSRLHDNGLSNCHFSSSIACDALYLIACERPFCLAHQNLHTIDPCCASSHLYGQVQICLCLHLVYNVRSFLIWM